MNTFGTLFRLTTFGESHGAALGAVIDGCPAGIPLSIEHLQAALDRRRPGQSALTTARAEPDQIEVLSGLYRGHTLGTPIAAIVRNLDARPEAYQTIAHEPRPGHADAVWRARFGHVDPRGGGRTSGRETLSRVVGGAVARAFLARALSQLHVVAWVAAVGGIRAAQPDAGLTPDRVDGHPTRCPDSGAADAIASAILEAKANGESLGGQVGLQISGLPVGLGEPVFGKTKALLADALLGIGAASGIAFGAISEAAPGTLAGSRFHADPIHYGGIQGGLTNGAPLTATIDFKPTATLGHLALAGRHDPCILPRVVPVVEAMAWLTVADLWLLARAYPHEAVS